MYQSTHERQKRVDDQTFVCGVADTVPGDARRRNDCFSRSVLQPDWWFQMKAKHISLKRMTPATDDTPLLAGDWYTSVWIYVCGQCGEIFDDLKAADKWLTGHPEHRLNTMEIRKLIRFAAKITTTTTASTVAKRAQATAPGAALFARASTELRPDAQP